MARQLLIRFSQRETVIGNKGDDSSRSSKFDDSVLPFESEQCFQWDAGRRKIGNIVA
jgi:hypothetical protein